MRNDFVRMFDILQYICISQYLCKNYLQLLDVCDDNNETKHKSLHMHTLANISMNTQIDFDDRSLLV